MTSLLPFKDPLLLNIQKEYYSIKKNKNRNLLKFWIDCLDNHDTYSLKEEQWLEFIEVISPHVDMNMALKNCFYVDQRSLNFTQKVWNKLINASDLISTDNTTPLFTYFDTCSEQHIFLDEDNLALFIEKTNLDNLQSKSLDFINPLFNLFTSYSNLKDFHLKERHIKLLIEKKQSHYPTEQEKHNLFQYLLEQSVENKDIPHISNELWIEVLNQTNLYECNAYSHTALTSYLSEIRSYDNRVPQLSADSLMEFIEKSDITTPFFCAGETATNHGALIEAIKAFDRNPNFPFQERHWQYLVNHGFFLEMYSKITIIELLDNKNKPPLTQEQWSYLINAYLDTAASKINILRVALDHLNKSEEIFNFAWPYIKNKKEVIDAFRDNNYHGKYTNLLNSDTITTFIEHYTLNERIEKIENTSAIHKI